MQHRFAVKLFTAAKAMGIHTALDSNGYYGDRVSDDDSRRSTSCCSISRRGIPNGIAGSPAWMSARRGSLPNVLRAAGGRSGSGTSWCRA